MRPSRERTETTRDDLVEQARDPNHEELVEVAREDAAELDALEQRLVRVCRKLEHAAVEIEPGKLAIQQRFGGGVRMQARSGHGALSIAEPR